MITVGFIGLGLIGGSIAKALKKSDPSIQIIAYNRSQSALQDALSEGVIDIALEKINSAFQSCDMIFLCTPVELNSKYLHEIRHYMKPGSIVTDVGSVKGYIHSTVAELGMEDCFIGGHPMAGSEKTGYAAASDILLENAYFAITPTPLTKESALNFYIALVEKTGAIPVVVNPEEHDYAVAGISHVPHLIASGLVNMVHENDTPDELMKMLAAGGFKDITRIASSSADMWSQICATNSKQISKVLSSYIHYLLKIKSMVDTNDEEGIHQMFTESKEYRDSIDIMRKGPVMRNHVLYCDLEDKEGAISSITLLLSQNHISIKNIGIIHNREFEQGVLLMEFYEDASAKEATALLIDHGYQLT